MNVQTCDPNILDAFVRSELSEQQESELTAHLDQCAGCGNELERRVAAADQWREASELLTQQDSKSFAVADTAEAANDRQMAYVVGMLTPTDDPEMLGRIGGYEVSGVVGSGGMGVVFKAHDRSLDRVVAIKVMAPHLAGSGAARKRFARESKAAAAVLHPNVIAIYSVADDPKLPYLVMPYVAGTSLQKRIEADGPLCVQDTLRIGQQIAAGLAAAHVQGLVHRDIKPANILLERGVERVTITDFGLARAVDDATMTRSGVIAGTPQYMSPEQARGESIDHRSDLFSLGSVLYAMCTGHSPFRAETTFGILRRITDNQPRPIREINPDVPEWLCAIITKLHAKESSNRFQSAEEVAELLEGCLAHAQLPTSTPLPESVAEPVRSFDSPGRSVSSFGGFHLPPIGKLVAAAAIAFALAFAGVLIVLELNKGTLIIESDVDNVPIRIFQGDHVVKKLTVSKQGGSTRVAAGNYVVEIDGKFDGIDIRGGRVTLDRFGTTVVRIRQDGDNSAATAEEINSKGRPNAIARSDTDFSHKQRKVDTNARTKEQHQYLFWTASDTVRLSEWFAKSLRLDEHRLASVNELLAQTWRKYIELEGTHIQYSRTSEGHLKAVVGRFAIEQSKLDNEFWDKLDAIVDGDARASLHALSTQRGDGVGADSWPVKNSLRRKAFPSILGWNKKIRTKEIEIWRKGAWYHYRIVTSQFRNSGEGEILPPELQHYWENGSEQTSANEIATGRRPATGQATIAKGDIKIDPREARTLDEVTLAYNVQTRKLRHELFDPPIPDLTKEQFRAAMLDVVDGFRKQGKEETAAAFEDSVDNDRLVERLTFVGFAGSRRMSQHFRQITPAFHFEISPSHMRLIVLAKAELRYSPNWTSKTWGDIHAPLNGKFELVSIEQQGEMLTSRAFNQWKKSHSIWERLEITDTSISMMGDSNETYEFTIDYETGRMSPEFRISQKGETKFEGRWMGYAFADDAKLDLALDLKGRIMPKTFQTSNGMTTKLSYRRIKNESPSNADEQNVPDTIGQGTDRAKASANEIAFVLGKSQFEPGDNIEIESITSTGDGFAIGATVTVKGRYTLRSIGNANLGFYSTVSLKPGEKPIGTPIQPSQRMEAKLGTHPFSLTKEITAIGNPHVTFYHPDSGQEMGGVYFAADSPLNTEKGNASNTKKQASDNDRLVNTPPMEFDTLEDFLKPGNDLFDRKMKQIDERLATAKEGTAEHRLFRTKKKQLQQQWDLSIAQVKGMVAAAEAGNPVQLAPIVIPSNPRPWQAPMPDPLQTHDEEIAKVLAGTWDINYPTSYGENGEQNEFDAISASFSKNMLIIRAQIGNEYNETQYIYRVSGDKIDLWGYDPNKSQTDRLHPMLGSFTLHDDTLRISHHDQEMEVGQPQPRPPVQAGKGLVYYIMKRRRTPDHASDADDAKQVQSSIPDSFGNEEAVDGSTGEATASETRVHPEP